MKLLKLVLKKIICIIPLNWAERYMIWKVGYPTTSYGPNGEDITIKNMFWGKRSGFYVDVGAHHPTRFSNTRLLYKIGWNGINIDAMPGSMKIFQRERSRDINIEMAISSRPETHVYNIFDEGAYNTLSKKLAEEYQIKGKTKKGEVSLKSETLSKILDLHLPDNTKIDLLSVDVEGYDMEVLKSNDWSKYRPEVISIEEIGFDAEAPQNSEIFKFLKDQGYHLEIATPKTIFFRLKK